MWVKALDILLDRLKIAGVDFSKVASLSGTAQVSYTYAVH
jgi:xylulokinase